MERLNFLAFKPGLYTLYVVGEPINTKSLTRHTGRTWRIWCERVDIEILYYLLRCWQTARAMLEALDGMMLCLITLAMIAVLGQERSLHGSGLPMHELDVSNVING